MIGRGAISRAYVIGSGPNGLTAAIMLAQAGLETTVFEAQPTIGGGTRSAELTLPGFLHDVCSAVHPLALSSPIFATFPLRDFGLEWIQPPIPLAHPLDGGQSALLHQSLAETAAGLGSDGLAYRRAVGDLAQRWGDLCVDILAPLHWPQHPFSFARFGLLAPWPATLVAKMLFRRPQARALFAGMAAHSFLPLESVVSAAFAWVLGIAGHAVGWPIPRGGSQAIADALGRYFQSLGGKVITGTPIASLDEFEPNALVVCDVTPRQLLRIAGGRLPQSYRRKLERYRYGPGVFKLDWALDAPIPWQSPGCAQAGTVHVGGTMEEIAASERLIHQGQESDRPFTLVAQPSLFDSTRAPAGKHTAWAYCHVPNGSTKNMTGPIEAQIERFAPGFGARILARSATNSVELEARNANLVGGDINGGAQDILQLFARPNGSVYRTPAPGFYLCSSSTPPGGGVHGMCGFHAATMALRDAGLQR